MDSITASLAAFTVAASLITVTPGLDTMLVLRTAAVEGGRRAAAASTGILAGCLVWGSAVALGIGALVGTSRLLYDVLRIAGAAYLIYLGVGLLRAPHRQMSEPASPMRALGRSWFMRGLVTNLLNPKVGIFYVTFLPPFIPQGVLVFQFTLLLAFIHAALGAIWFALLIWGARSISRTITSPAAIRWLDRAVGGTLILLALKIAFSPRPQGAG